MNANRIALAVLGLCLSPLVVVWEPGSAHALGPRSVAVDEIAVYPTGDPAIDPARVQSAVDAAEHVLLKATDTSGVPTAFDFGANTPGGPFVVLGRDVIIRGETLGTHRTTITGGFAPFRSLAGNAVASSIRGIDFVSPGVAALFVTGATGVTFVDNRVRGVVGLPDWVPGISKGQAVWVVGAETVTGEIVITDNVIRDVDAQNGYGFALWGFSADARIQRNDISGVDTSGILVGVHSGQVWIEGNHVAPGLPKYPDSPFAGGNGITVGNASGGSTYVRDNTVDCVNPLADGILVAASSVLGDVQEHAVIERNQVTMHGSQYSAIGLIGSVSNTLIANNHVDGDGWFAFYGLWWFSPDEVLESNTFIGNNVSHFRSSFADVAFDVNTRGNLVIGRVKSVIDLGVDNWISGTSTARPPVPPGRRLSTDRHPALGDAGLVPSILTTRGGP